MRFLPDFVLSFGVLSFYKICGILGRPVSFERGLAPALVLAPHPDDETLGCGAAILSMREAGRLVYVIVVTDGREDDPSLRLVQQRAEEVVAACALLKIHSQNVIFLGLPDGHARQFVPKIEEDLSILIDQIQPSDIFVPSLFDRHPDHQAVAQALDSLIKKGDVSCSVYAYSVWVSVKDLCLRLLNPFAWSSIRLLPCGDFLPWKQHAFLAHQSQAYPIKDVYGLKLSPWARYFLPFEVFFEKKGRL